MLKKILFKLAKSPFMGKVVGKTFQYCPWAIPVQKVHCSKEVLAFYHPSPSYANHLILSPRKAIQNLQQLATEHLAGYFIQIMDAAKDICAKHAAYQDAFVLIANGGKKQDVQQVHFHMFTNHPMVKGSFAEKAFYADDVLCVLEPSKPEWDVHYVLCPALDHGQGQSAYFRRVLQSIELLNAKGSIAEKGYSLLFQYTGKEADWERPVFHLVAGKKRG